MFERIAHRLERRFATLAPQASDFAPGLLAIQESPPARLPRLVFYLVAVLFAILLAWSIFSRVDIVASAEGKLVPKTFTKIVQPADSGIVRDILVTDGQVVKAGQVLLRMDATAASADLLTLRYAGTIEVEIFNERVWSMHVDEIVTLTRNRFIACA